MRVNFPMGLLVTWYQNKTISVLHKSPLHYYGVNLPDQMGSPPNSDFTSLLPKERDDWSKPNSSFANSLLTECCSTVASNCASFSSFKRKGEKKLHLEDLSPSS